MVYYCWTNNRNFFADTLELAAKPLPRELSKGHNLMVITSEKLSSSLKISLPYRFQVEEPKLDEILTNRDIIKKIFLYNDGSEKGRIEQKLKPDFYEVYGNNYLLFDKLNKVILFGIDEHERKLQTQSFRQAWYRGYYLFGWHFFRTILVHSHVLLFPDRRNSILILGKSGSGKTTAYTLLLKSKMFMDIDSLHNNECQIDVHYVLFKEKLMVCIPESDFYVPIKAIVLPERDKNIAKNSLIRNNKSYILAKLFNAVHYYLDAPEYKEIVAMMFRIAYNLPCVFLFWGKTDEEVKQNAMKTAKCLYNLCT